MQNPTHTQTEVKPGIDWAKTCIGYAKTVWGIATVIGVPLITLLYIYKVARLEQTVKAAAWQGSSLGFMMGIALTGLLFTHIERKLK
jgi:hypothetical protein